MASSLAFNKVAAAILTACLVGSISGVVARVLVHPHPLPESVYKVPGLEEIQAASGAAGGDAKAAGPEPVEPLLAQATVAQGQEAAKKCAACHGFEAGGPNKVGPNLHGVLGRDIASHGGFQYSAALTGIEGNWDIEKMNQFLYKPSGYAKGTKMAFAGISKTQERAAVIKYLESLK